MSERNTRGVINAADLCVAEGDLYRAEEALQKALREVRDQQTEADNAAD